MADATEQGPIRGAGGRRAQAGTRPVLIIDDDPDTCELLVLALTRDGYAVDSAYSCQEALARLQARRYGLVISDYELPDGTAATWIRAAARAGRLKNTPVLIATAHPDPPGVGHLEILRKPFDLERMLQQVGLMTERGRSGRATPRDPDSAEGAVELVLYVTAGATASEKARLHLGELTGRYPAGTFALVVRDVATHSADAESDKVVFTPTLVKRHPAPATWVIGDLTLQEQLAGLLEAWGVPPRD